ncbi:hypothetical protein GCM10007148_24570 [Parvularcula lutaonensis]|nr:hypothetical protein GCM10007148_24570 [Parvularcula lutaonensis]
MSLWGWLRGIAARVDYRNKPHAPVDEGGLQRFRDIRSDLSREFVGLMPDKPAGSADLTRSRVGGPIAWPSGEILPADKLGKPLLLLAQVNFDEMPSLDPFPRDGLLQFFVADDDIFGCEFPSTEKMVSASCITPTLAS